MRQDCKDALKRTIAELKNTGIKYDAYDDIRFICQHGLMHEPENKWEYKKYTDYVKEIALKEVTEDEKHASLWRSLYWETVKLESFWFFESFLIYMEHKRPYEKKFYEPRAMTQKTVALDLQALEDSKTQKMYTLSEPPRVGKSTMMVFFLVWIVLRNPYSHNALATHSGELAKHFYELALNFFTDKEYCFQELFEYFQPDKKGMVEKSAEYMSIKFETTGDFNTCIFKGCDGTWTGNIDISEDGYLFVDDLIRDDVHALNPKRMNDTFTLYLNRLVDRKNDGAKEVMIGTLWNVNDPIMRLEKIYKDNPNYVFRKIPALNTNDETNFGYEVKGFSTQYYKDLREKMLKAGEEAFWMAKFQQAPYDRGNQIFTTDSIRWFNGILTPGNQYEFVVVCDTAMGGGDSVSMPIGLKDKTTNWTYIVDWYFNNAGVVVTIPGVCDMIIKHGVMDVTFEKNAGGLMFAKKVNEELRKRNYICNCNTKPAPNNISKDDKIRGCADVILSNFIFLNETKHTLDKQDDVLMYNRSPMYQRAIEETLGYTANAKKQHDDAPDSLAQLAIKAYNTYGLAEVKAIDRRLLGI